MPECKGLAESFYLRGRTIVASGWQWFQTKLSRRHIQRDQVLREDIHANDAVHFRNLPRRGLNKAIVKFKIANHNLIDPRHVANCRPRLAYSFQRLLG